MGEMHDEMVEAAAGAGIANARAATGAGEFLPVFAVHSQDEADNRILTGNLRDGPGIPRRQRASKVQSHVLDVLCKGQRY